MRSLSGDPPNRHPIGGGWFSVSLAGVLMRRVGWALAEFCRRHHRLTALVGYVLLVLLAARHIVAENRTMGPEAVLDQDGLYGRVGAPRQRHHDDPAPACIDYPRDLMIAHSLKASPPFAWNPWSGTGVPLVAEQGGAFFPLRVLFYLAPSPATYDLFRLARLVLAAMGAYALARSRGRSKWASFVAGGLFELTGALIWMAPFAPLSSIYMLPWLLYGIHLLFAERGGRSIMVAGASLGLVLLGGHPGLAAICLLAGAAAFLGHSAESIREPARILRPLVLALVSVFVGALVSACNTLPFLELLAHGYSYKQGAYALPIWRLDRFLMRDLFGLGMFAPTLVDRLRDTYYYYPYSLSGVCGLIALFLAAAAVFRRKLDLRLGLVAAAGIVLVFGPPGFSWVGRLPGIQNILPRYSVALVTLPISQWAASGLELLAGSRGRIDRPPQSTVSLGWSRPSAQVLAVLCALGVCAGLFLIWSLGMSAGLRSQIRSSLWQQPAYPYRYLALVALICIGLVLGRWRFEWGRLFLGLAALMELALYQMPHLAEPVSASMRDGRPAIVSELARLTREGHSRLASNNKWLGLTQFNLLDRIPDLRMTAAIVPERYNLYMSLLGSDFVTIFWPQVTSSPFLDIASVQYLVLRTDAPDLSRIATTAGGALYRNPHALPRARLVNDVTVVSDQAQALFWLREAGKSGAHASDTILLGRAVVEAAPGEMASLSGGPASSSPARAALSSVVFARDEPDQVLLSVETPSPALLILSDTYYPGWQATIDGVHTKIHPTNLLFRGVIVPAGRHAVGFEYRPATLWVGLLLSMLGLACVLAALFVDRWGRGNRRGRTHAPVLRADTTS